MTVNQLTSDVIGAAMKVHSALGPGLLERTYQVCLAHELRKRRHEVRTEVPVPIVYDGITVEAGYRIDLVVDGRVIVETKAVSQVLDVHRSQLLTQLKLSGLQVGLLLNFHSQHLRDGIIRLANHAP